MKANLHPTSGAPSDLLPPLDLPRIPSQRRSHQKHERLLAAGFAVFENHGYHQATVDVITAEAKVSTGTFYAYFRDKRQLLLLLLGEQLDLLADALAALDLSARPLAAIEQLVGEIIGPEASFCGIWQAWNEASRYDPELAAYDRKIDAWVESMLLTAMDRVGEDEGLRPDLDRCSMAQGIRSLLWSLCCDPADDPEIMARSVSQMILHSLFVDR